MKYVRTLLIVLAISIFSTVSAKTYTVKSGDGSTLQIAQKVIEGSDPPEVKLQRLKVANPGVNFHYSSLPLETVLTIPEPEEKKAAIPIAQASSVAVVETEVSPNWITPEVNFGYWGAWNQDTDFSYKYLQAKVKGQVSKKVQLGVAGTIGITKGNFGDDDEISSSGYQAGGGLTIDVNSPSAWFSGVGFEVGFKHDYEETKRLHSSDYQTMQNSDLIYVTNQTIIYNRGIDIGQAWMNQTQFNLNWEQGIKQEKSSMLNDSVTDEGVYDKSGISLALRQSLVKCQGKNFNCSPLILGVSSIYSGGTQRWYGEYTYGMKVQYNFEDLLNLNLGYRTYQGKKENFNVGVTVNVVTLGKAIF